MADHYCIHHFISPSTRSHTKTYFNKVSRQIGQQQLKEIKQAFNNGYDISELYDLDYITDRRYIKLKSRKGDFDIINQKCSGGRVIMGVEW